ncbi:Hypothetical_protein [Hexamita inflata]|uniref:Hypothetical_protein n=1 Tax=Hexamita inflata TaxID=28002 RepID=A0AA86RBL1_9EUKA|nr:Hypothetical protein HINF_LOCUS59293 [Hexamita inflata]
MTFQSRGQYLRQIYLWSLVQFPVNALFCSKIGRNPKKRLKTAVGQICTTVVKTVETVDQKPQNRRFGTPYFVAAKLLDFHNHVHNRLFKILSNDFRNQIGSPLQNKHELPFIIQIIRN